MSDDDIKKARELIENAPDYIEQENVGRPYMPDYQPTAESKAFYAAAREGWPAALDEVNRAESRVTALEAALRDACDLAEEGWSYAGDYFNDKHDSAGRIAECRALLDGGSGGGEGRR